MVTGTSNNNQGQPNTPSRRTDTSTGTLASGAPCLRCRSAVPTDDDGFCDACRKALVEACL
jgi:hypothetical protein